MEFDLESLDWSPRTVVETARGTRSMRTAPGNIELQTTPAFKEAAQKFWEIWRTDRLELKDRGINTSRDDGRPPVYTIIQWSDMPVALAAQIAASQAVHADIIIPKPGDLTFDYFPFQKAGVRFAHTDDSLTTLKRGTLIADEMGLGKTIQAVGAINLHPELRKVLIICPASLKYNWRNELCRWLVNRQTRIGIATSADGVPNSAIVIVNYDILGKLQEQLMAQAFDLIILDEAHVVRNMDTIKYKALKPLCDQAKSVIALTGTPVWNRAQDLEALLRVLGEDFTTTWKDFGKFRYMTGNPKRQAELNRRLRQSVMVRREKSQVMAELPPKLRQIIELPANGASGSVNAEIAQYAERESVMQQLQAALEIAKVSENQEEYLQALQALKDFARASFEELSRIRHETALAKTEHVIEHLKTIHDEDPTRKVVLFGHHRDVLAKISDAFGCKVIQGGVDVEKRQQIVDDFNTNPETWLVCGSIRAMGFGFTLTASSWVVFAELDWVPAIMSQAEDRVHRIGQTADTITIQHIVLEKSLDARMAHVIVEKQAIMDGTTGLLEAEEPVLPSVQPSSVITFDRTEPVNGPIQVSQRQIALDASGLTEETVLKIHEGLKVLAGVCDGAVTLDNVGFNGCDTLIGKSFAAQAGLSAKQAALGKRLLKKYHRQLGQWVLEL